jgi:apolipoprotein N-acyltransferase
MVSTLKSAVPAVLLTALLEWFGSGLSPWWPLIWLAPLPIFWLVLRVEIKLAALAAFIAWFLGCFTLWPYFHDIIQMPLAISLLVFALQAGLFTLTALLFRALVRRGERWLALFGAPSLWVAGEYANSLTSPHGTNGALAYTQLDFLPALQLAALTGPWGISFILILTSAALALGLSQPPDWRALRAAGGGLAVVAVALVFGAIRLATPQGGDMVKVGLLAADQDGRASLADEGGPALALLAEYAQRAAALAERGAQVLVLPEKIAVIVEPDEAHTDRPLQELADQTGMQIVAGVLRVEDGKKYNEARLYSPQVPVITYDKQHMLPPFESALTPGNALTMLAKAGGFWGVAICKDMDFTDPARRYGAAGVGLMLVPAWDFVADAWQHGHIAIMRGVESGYAVVRSAKQGFLTVSDDRGRVLAEGQSWSGPFGALMATVPSGHDGTLYLRFGDWFAWASVALLAAAVLRLGAKRRS